jgi:hypothetical protein
LWQTLAETTIVVPMGGVEYLVIDHRDKTALATWRDQTEWGYLHIDLESLTAKPASLEWPTASLPPPEFGLRDDI